MKRLVPLEKAAETLCMETSSPPFIYQLPPEAGRKKLDAAQDSPVFKYPATVDNFRVDAGEWGDVDLFCIKPHHLPENPGVIFYIHGAGWVFGNLHTHDKLVRELAARTGSIVFFPEYSLSPEAKYPAAIEQCYRCLEVLPEIAEDMRWNMDFNRLTVAGDSVGGNMATVMAILSKHRSGPRIQKQLLYYPVTNACFTTRSYNEFACDYYLHRAGMMWFWNQYTSCEQDRREITACPLLATPEELSGLPEAMIINGEADVLRDEGEAYARKLRKAGVSVTALRVQAIVHDFVMLNSLDQTDGCRSAMDASVQWLNRGNAV